ncbi:MAG: GNAT family N-acetyltransferase [Oscillospiraceae bacterium]|nr:GNAT family N-acetyltransferase [Oscillospiraceae bacterium]
MDEKTPAGRTTNESIFVLRPVTKDNIDELLALEINDDQKGFVSTVAESLAQAYVYYDTAYPFAVYDGDEAVGFIMMAYYNAKQYYTLWKLLIDRRHQNRGAGRAALEQGIAFLKERFGAREIYTGVVPENAVAKRLYSSVGFVPTGLFEFGMEEWRLDIADPQGFQDKKPAM